MNCRFLDPPDLTRRVRAAVDSGARKMRSTGDSKAESSCRNLVGDIRGGILERYTTPLFAMAWRDSDTRSTDRTDFLLDLLKDSVLDEYRSSDAASSSSDNSGSLDLWVSMSADDGLGSRREVGFDNTSVFNFRRFVLDRWWISVSIRDSSSGRICANVFYALRTEIKKGKSENSTVLVGIKTLSATLSARLVRWLHTRAFLN